MHKQQQKGNADEDGTENWKLMEAVKADRPILEKFPVTLHIQNQASERNIEERK